MASPSVVAGATTSISSGANSTTYTANRPTTVADGDVLYCTLEFRANTVPTFTTTPTGWTLVKSQGGSSAAIVTFVKPLPSNAASEPSTYSWISATSLGYIASIRRITGANTTTPVNGTAVSAQDAASGLTHVMSQITTTVADTLILYDLGGAAQVTTTWPAGTTENYDTVGGSGATSNRMSSGAEEAQAAAALSTSRTATTSASETASKITAAIAPSGGGPPAAKSLVIPTNTVQRMLMRR